MKPRKQIDRRDFVRFVTGGVAGAAASGLSLYGVGRLGGGDRAEEVKVPGGPEEWRLGVCSLCEAGCGLRVRTIGKRVVKIQGNPLDPCAGQRKIARGKVHHLADTRRVPGRAFALDPWPKRGEHGSDIKWQFVDVHEGGP